MTNTTITVIIVGLVVIVALYIDYDSTRAIPLRVDWMGLITAILISAALTLLYVRGWQNGRKSGHEEGIKATTEWLKEKMADDVKIDTVVISENVTELCERYDNGDRGESKTTN